MISAIVAVDENWGIGSNGDLLEKIPEDMKFFKEKIEGNLLICGSKTWDSLPRRAFAQRPMIIISRRWNEMTSNHLIAVPNTFNYWMSLEQCIDFLTNKIKDGLYRASNGIDKDIFVIGGGQIYKELLPLCDRVYVTKIFKSHENVDTYFPDLDEPEMWDTWKVTEQSEVKVYDDIMYQFWTYDRIN
jgi:dihydrofolate reductase